MANLRDLIDGKAVDPQDKGDVYNHLKDVKDKQSEADMAKLKLHQKLAPARQMIEMVDQEHPMPGSQDQQQVDELGNPIQNPAGMNQNQQMKPGMQTNPANARQQTGQNMKQNAGQSMQKKPGFPNANKASTQSKMPTKKKPADKKESGRGFEVHVKAGGERIDRMNVKKRKQLKGRYDYHDDAGMDQGGGRGIGLSGRKS